MQIKKSLRFLLISLCAIMFHGNVFAVDDLDCTRIGWGLDENNNCVQCSGAAGVKETKTPSSDSEYCFYAGNEIYDIVDNGDRCIVKMHICYSCSGTNTPYPNENHSECTTCKDTGYGVVDGVCVKCTDNQNSSYDQNMDANVCVENPCASDTSCLTAGCGKVDGQCQQCSGDKPYSLKINAVSVSYNICVPNIAEENSDAATCYENNKSCVCKSGFGAQDYVAATLFTPEQPGGCYACGENYITADNACVQCIGGQVANHEDNKCVCPGENQIFNGTKQKCVCMSGMGLNEHNECETLGDGQIINKEYKLEKCSFGRVPNQDKNKCNPCSSPYVANKDQTACVTTCEGQGYGKLTENGYSQCVVCSEQTNANGGQMLENNGVCVDGCGAYQITQDGSCGYCNLYYNFNTKTCVNTCNNSYPVSDEGTNVNVCCGEYQYFDDSAKECKSCESNQWFESESRTCKSCPKNFVCNGETKERCPYGTVSEEGVSNCKKPADITDEGFMFCSENEYCEHKNKEDYDKSSDEEIGNYKYVSCYTYNSIQKTLDDVNVCEKCKEYEHVYNNKCLCGENNQDNRRYGLIKGVITTDNDMIIKNEVCQICPKEYSDVEVSKETEPYACGKCKKGGFYWDGTKYVCTACPDGTGLYEKDGYTWCLTHTELMAVMGQMEQDASYYYIDDDNVWNTNCPAGSCCLLGKKYSCKKGTVSLANMVCENGTPGQCVGCGGKTTKSEETSCDGYQDLDTCKNNMCTVSITPTKFCIGLNSATGMCFEIEEIKMSLKDGVGVYNTNDITGKNNSGQ